MSDLYGIAKSGLHAYKEGLATTGQNIANVGNEAYARREAPVSEIKSGSDVLQISNTAGFGVKIDGITRAFDQFIDAQMQSATSGFSFSESHAVVLSQLEQVVRPSKGTVSQRIQELFSSFNAVSQDPSDLAARHVAIDASKGVVNSITTVAKGLNDLRQLVRANISNDVSEANSILKQLVQIQKEVMGSVSTKGVSNDLLDQRDALLEKLSQLIDVSVDYKNGGEVEINAGTLGQGQSLLSGVNPSSLVVQVVDGQSKLFIQNAFGNDLSKIQVHGGRIAGSLAADLTLVETKASLDDLTRKLVGEFNKTHKMGVDLNGEVGKNYFSLDGIEIEKKGEMTSSSQINVAGEVDRLIGKSFRIDYSAADGLWTLRDNRGIELQTFESSIEYEGLKVNISGKPSIGDTFNLKFSEGLSENLELRLQDGRELAASAFYLVEKSSNNGTSTDISLSHFAEPKEGNLIDLSEIFSGSQNSANPSNFIKNGVLGVFENIDDLSQLTSIKTQPKIQFGTKITNINSATELTLTLDNNDHVFTVGDLADSIDNFSVLAEFLNNGSIRDANNRSFSDLGLRAGGNISTLSVTSAAMSDQSVYPVLSAGLLGASRGILIPAEIGNADLQIFTREGVHLAGTALSQAQISDLLTNENGFSTDARYVADYLSTDINDTYIGSSISRLTTEGNFVASISSLGLKTDLNSNFNVDVMASFPNSRDKMAAPLEITNGAGHVRSFTPEQGMMAGNIAEALNKSLKEIGLSATSSNRLELFELEDGNVAFDLVGDNATAVSIVASITSGDTADLVYEINKYSNETGVSAFKSGLGSIILEKNDGNDISIKNVVTSNNSNILARQIDEFGETITSDAVSVPLSVSTGDFIISGGQIKIIGTSSFDVLSGVNGVTSRNSEFDSGFATKDFDLLNNSTNFSFTAMQSVDDNFTDEAGLLAVSASGSYSFTVSTENTNQNNSVLYKPNSSEGLSSGSISKQIVAKLREGSPQTTFVGNEFEFLDGFPANGSSLEFRLGDQTYFASLKTETEYTVDGNEVIIGEERFSYQDALSKIINESSFQISGPEKDRIFVGFEAVGSGFRIFASAKDGILSGDGIRLSQNNSLAQKTTFHIDEGIGDTKTKISGSEFDTSQVAKADFAQLVIGSQIVNLSFDPNSDPKVSQSVATPGVSILIEQTGVDKGKLVIEVDQSAAELDVRLKANNNSTTFGIITSSAQLTLNDTGFSLKNLGNSRVTTTAEINSLANEVISVSQLGGEDLIVIATGSGKVSLLGQSQKDNFELNPRELLAKVSSDDSNTIEIFDLKTDDFIGSRTINSSNNFLFRDFKWQLDGNVAANDIFEVRTSTERRDDASNLKNLMALADVSPSTAEGGYSQLYNDLVIDVGFELRASEQALETAKVVYDVAADRKSAFSGVDLDTEAARLLEQQQAYQALAKVLSTAKEMVDTLLRSM